MEKERREIHQEEFEEGTVGHVVFPAGLEGKRRLDGFLDKEVNAVRTFGGGLREWTKLKKMAREGKLEEQGVSTMRELLTTPVENLSKKEKDNVLEGTREYFRNLAMGPEGKLISDLLGKSAGVVSNFMDEMRTEIVHEIIEDRLRERDQNIVHRRYGLNDGFPQTLEEVAGEIKATRERMRQIESKALRTMRKDNQRLYAFVQYSEETLAEQMGVTCWGDLLSSGKVNEQGELPIGEFEDVVLSGLIRLQEQLGVPILSDDIRSINVPLLIGASREREGDMDLWEDVTGRIREVLES